MADKLEYYSVGDLRKVLEGLEDNVPVVSAPISDKVRVALDVSIFDDAKLGDYTGKIVVFNTGLFDIASGKRVVLSPGTEEDEQGNN